MTFRELGLIAPILKALDEQGYKNPSPIQTKAIPPALAGRDVLGCAQTGTGKTCAFATPILQRLHSKKTDGRPIRALILTPTRELAIQIGESFEAYGKHLPLRTGVIFGGVGQNPQVEKLQKGVDILVATPGRLEDLHQQGFIDVSRLEIFVLDEADRMLDMGFIHDVKKILKWLPAKKQTLFFSATMPLEITELVNSLLHDPVRVAVDPISSPVEVIEQSVYFVDRGNKTKLLARLVEDQNARSVLVFTRTKHGANKVARDLEKSGIAAAAIHGNKSQTARQHALADFKAGRVRVLVATDIAARGLDIEDLSHVFNYNLPEVPETYVHRIGRTGRAGKGGVAVALCDYSEKPLLREIEKLIGKKVPVVEGHPWPMEVFEIPLKDKHGRPVNAEDAEAREAARERSRARREAAKAAAEKKEKETKSVPAPEPPAPAQEEPSAKKKRRKKKKKSQPEGTQQPVTVQAESKSKSKSEPQTKPEPEPMPEPSWLRTERPKLTRPGTRFDTGDMMPVTEFKRPDPLAGDRIMDATARLLAPRRMPRPVPVVTAPPAPRKEEPAGEKKRRRKKKSGVPAVPAADAGPEKVKSAPKQEKPVREKKKEPPKTQKKQENPKPERKRKKPAQESRPEAKRDRSRRLPEAPPRTRTKDSTEQKSLMKPYYLSDER